MGFVRTVREVGNEERRDGETGHSARNEETARRNFEASSCGSEDSTITFMPMFSSSRRVHLRSPSTFTSTDDKPNIEQTNSLARIDKRVDVERMLIQIIGQRFV